MEIYDSTLHTLNFNLITRHSEGVGHPRTRTHGYLMMIVIPTTGSLYKRLDRLLV